MDSLSLPGGCQSIRRSIHFYFAKLLLLFERRLMYFRTLAFVCACHHARVNTQLCLCNSLRDSTARETFSFIHVHYECCNLFSREHNQKRRSHAHFFFLFLFRTWIDIYSMRCARVTSQCICGDYTRPLITEKWKHINSKREIREYEFLNCFFYTEAIQ